ncbi:putative damage-inducible protein DinB [Lipingzhangella halophila]|uniref:Putative damage-inducible protein DinB n=1 Tax=Lipingzhangella halophila TaxID=1783352 RepID=A0A7W7RFV0_9ACTN|nr:DinB family protein [Lipingzhangella halophila]MBB4930908.1 putative damage-inducible protein DinB [Lipingzhangella halophila]
MVPSAEQTPQATPSAEDDLNTAIQAAAQATTGDERETLTAVLDYMRASVVAKVAGLNEEEARRRLVPSLTTPAGMLRHLTVVERNWFQVVLLGESAAKLGLVSSGGDESWEVPDEATVASLIEEYKRACAESRAAAAGLALDHTVAQHELGQVSLRWILVHMVEETARHAGHVDILREQINAAARQG